MVTNPSEAAVSGAQNLHARLVALARESAQADARLARLLAECWVTGAHKVLGFAKKSDYCEHLGLSYEKARCLARLGQRFEDIPELETALVEGLGWSKLRELDRVVTADTASDWVAYAKTHSQREVSRAARGSEMGEPPPAPGEVRTPRMERILFEVTPSDAEIVRRALAVLQSQTAQHGGDFQRGHAITLLCQDYLARSPGEEAPSEPGHLVVVNRCPDCGQVAGVQHALDSDEASRALDDCEIVDFELDESSAKAVDQLSGRPEGTKGASPNVRQSISRRRRLQVLHRDEYTCRVPDCSCSLWLQLHHIRHVEQGGSNSRGNLVTLCGLHHRQHHAGRLAIHGDAEDTVYFSRPGRPRVASPPRSRRGAAEEEPSPPT